MTKRPHLTAFRKALEAATVFDVNMQASTLLTLLLAAEHEEDPDGFSTGDVQAALGVSNGTASRNLQFWEKGNAAMPAGGMEYIRIGMDPMDRRKRTIALTPKGEAFIRKLEEIIGTSKG